MNFFLWEKGSFLHTCLESIEMGEFMTGTYRLGIDIGSTTVKVAILDQEKNLLFSDYRRHFANIQETLADLLEEAKEKLGDCTLSCMVTGSGGLSLAKHMGQPFCQEVVAVANSLKEFYPQTDVAIELGGEDAKIIYFKGGIDQRMNGICAGGTGSFIDQMASLLDTDASGLNELAKNFQMIYPIAARCGVFAKTDIQPLINEGAAREDLAASIFQAVCNQTISGLAQGKPIRGNVAFLGGPLHFMSELRNCFIRTLKLEGDAIINPENSHLFAAMGSALSIEEDAKEVQMMSLAKSLRAGFRMNSEISRMDCLFEKEEDYQSFIERHNRAKVPTGDLSGYKGKIFLGIDAGSTTTKVALISEEGELLYTFYSGNEGSPIATAIKAMKEIKEKLPEGAEISYSCSTGYGEALLKSAFQLDEGEVETIAHYYAASFFEPEVDCILDIGGQDMKCIHIKDGTVDNVQLNEACSSGCGSFLETFAKSLGYNVIDFSQEALFAETPTDLGSRCTVFMNSNVKQAQKEGATVADISAGLAYSVVKNALYKVIKVTNPRDLGKHIVVQGGTFYNNAVLRALEQILCQNVTRPDIAGIMGAFGAALIARERYSIETDKLENEILAGEADREYLDASGYKKTTMLPLEKIVNLEYETTMGRCQLCSNKCVLTISNFGGGRSFISGNRCERGAGKPKAKSEVPNLFKYKIKRVFGYEPLSIEEARRGEVGIPRVLNMYENYPFWAIFFKELGFRTVLSPSSNKKLYEMGIESIPSESECYPAKLVHGHIEWLIAKEQKFIFYPCIPYERNETSDAGNHYNCPMVTSYAENIKNNVESLEEKSILFMKPFLAFTNEKILTDQLCKVFVHPKDIQDSIKPAGDWTLEKIGEKFKEWNFTEKEIREAAHLAWEELLQSRKDIEDKGEETLMWMEQTGNRGIVLAGRPYHADPEIHHGIPELITSFNFAVLTEDSISHLAEVKRPIIVTDQWMYHSRLYKAAAFVKTQENLDFIQLNSFGCGLDAVTVDQAKDILNGSDKIFTVLKIDEVNNLGAARIRIRSLLAAIRVRAEKNYKRTIRSESYKRTLFTKDMKKEGYTILCPQMSPLHFELIEPAIRSEGYNLVVLDNDNRSAIDTGLQYVNNDSCYPSIIVVGQVMEALLSGKYDLEKTAVIMSQTGGGCRASNYIGFIRRALDKAGMGQIPVISLNANGMESTPGFTMTIPLLTKAMQGIVYGDLFMRLLYSTRPYELQEGSAEALHQKWKKICQESLSKKSIPFLEFGKNVKGIIRDFDALPMNTSLKKPKVGIVGEILVKFSPLANNHIVELLEKEGAEAVMPDLMDFLLYCFYNQNFKHENLGASWKGKTFCNIAIALLESFRKTARKELEKSKHFTAPGDIRELAKKARQYVSLGNQTGEGWFLTGEMLELIDEGVDNIVCTQPFGCLPNHIVGKGVIKELKRHNPGANIIAVDYDAGASEVNQLNRIKLMLTVAQNKIREQA